MRKYLMLILLMSLFTMLFSCQSGDFGAPEQSLMKPSVKVSVLSPEQMIKNGMVMQFTPIDGEIKGETLEQTENRIVVKITGVEDLIVATESGDLLVNGTIDYFIYELLRRDDGTWSVGYLTEIAGDITVNNYLTEGVMRFGAMLLDGDPEPLGECGDDEDCDDEIYPPMIGFHLECIDGVCRYIRNDGGQN